MSNVNSILSKLGYPSIPKDGSSVISSIISPQNSIVGSPSMSSLVSPSMSRGSLQFMSNIGDSLMNNGDFSETPLSLCFIDFNVSPLNIGGSADSTDSTASVPSTALINKSYTLIIGILNGNLPPNSTLSVSGSDGTTYNINKSITNPPNPIENPTNIVLVGEINVLSRVEKVVTYTIINNGEINNSANLTFKIDWVSSLPPTKFSTNPKCPVGTWSKIDITFTLEEFFNPGNITPSPAIDGYYLMTNQKLNRFIGFNSTIDNWGKYFVFLSALTHGYSYNRICNISFTPDFTPSTVSPTSILKLSFIISDINLGTEPELNQIDPFLQNNKISHRCIGDWLKSNYKSVSDLIYMESSEKPLIMSVPTSCAIENFTIDKSEVTISPPRPPTPSPSPSRSNPSPSSPLSPSSQSSSKSSFNSMIYIIITVIILVTFYIYRSKQY
jgi:hypothetical protein